MFKYMFCLLAALRVICEGDSGDASGSAMIEVVDMTHPTSIKVIAEYYGAVDKRWKICINCGAPALGTTMHLEHESSSSQAMYPAVIPTEYLLTRLEIIDVSSLATLQPTLVLTVDVALQWAVLRRDPPEPTLLLFKFGWKQQQTNINTCACKIPGMSLELAEWIAANLTHVAGVATDAPTLESEQTREFNTRTIASELGRSGIYMLENVNVRKKLPERGCMAIAMPLMLQNANYVPSRLTAFCPGSRVGDGGAWGKGGVGGVGGARGAARRVVLALRAQRDLPAPSLARGRSHDVDLDEILN